MNAATSPNRLIYQTGPLKSAIRICGSPKVSLNMSFSKRANLSAALISFPEGAGNGTIVTRGWMDPENRNSEYVSEPTAAGTFYRMNFTFQPKDTVIAAGRRLALMVFSSDREYTIRPAPGTQLALDLSSSTMTLPVVGGSGALAPAISEGITQVPGPGHRQRARHAVAHAGRAGFVRRLHPGGDAGLHGHHNWHGGLFRR